LLLLFEIRYKQALKEAARKMQELMGKGLDAKTEIWNERCQVQLVNAARNYTHFFILLNFYNSLTDPSKQLAILGYSPVQRLSEGSLSLLKMLYRNYALNHYLNEAHESFYENMPSQEYVDYFAQRAEYQRVYKEEMYALAMSSLDLVDAWAFHDDEIASALGQKGFKDADQIYSRILEVVRHNPLNRKEVPRGFNRYMQPLLLGKL
jgi:hypothetical protein